MEKLHLTHKRAQIWGMDLVIGVTIFVLSMATLYLFTLNESDDSEEKIEDLSHTGKTLSDILLSEGVPEDWNSTTVSRIGLLTGEKINDTKLEKFYNLTVSNYALTKSLFNTEYDYYFFLDDNMTVNGASIEGIGKPGVNKDSINAKNLVKISRITIYKNKLTSAKLYVWDS